MTEDHGLTVETVDNLSSSSSPESAHGRHSISDDHRRNEVFKSQRFQKGASKIRRLLSPRTRNIICHDWLWEIIAMLFSLICMGVVLVFLSRVNGMPVEQWAFKITPNAVVSFIATLAKSSFIMVIAEIIGQLKWLHFSNGYQALMDIECFDEASRGPWGSARLLVRKNRKTMLASTAALVTILALFMDPLIQLVIVFRSRSLPLSHLPRTTESPLASFSTATMFIPSEIIRQDESGRSASNSIGTAMENAILDGLLGRSWSPSFGCSTGNCTWLDRNLTTLAVCGSCSDDSKELTVDCSLKGPPRADLTECSYLFPNGLELSASIKRPWVMDIASAQRTIQTEWNSTIGTLPLDRSGLKMIDPPATIANFSAIQVPNATDDRTLPPPRASTCRLDFCIKTFRDVRSENGSLVIGATSETPLTVKPIYSEVGTRGGGLQWSEPSANSSSVRYLQELQLRPATTSESFRADVDFLGFANLQSYLVGTLSFARTSGGETVFSGKILPNNVTGTSPPQIPSVSDFSAHLSRAEDLDTLMRSLASRMTEAVRLGGGSNVTGSALTQRTVIEVRWGLLAYPMILLFVSAIMLGTIIQRTKAHKQVPFKNSGLALLFHNIESTRVQDVAITSSRDLDRVAGNLKGRLTMDDGRLLVVTEDGGESRNSLEVSQLAPNDVLRAV